MDTLSLHQASEALKVGFQPPISIWSPLTWPWQCFFLLQIFYKLAINCTKLSILFLYLRIFTDRLRFVRACWCLIVLVLCACTCFTTATIFQCSPVNAAWERWKPGSSCVDVYALWYSNAIYNIMTDFVIVLMVPPVIFNLKLPIRQKLALTCVFGLGVIVCAASISRLTTLYSSAYGNDATAGSLVSTIWTTIEAGLGVICANLPMLRTPLQHFFPKIFSHRASTNQILSTNLSQTADLHEDGSIPSPMLTAVPNSGRDAGLPNHPCAARNATCPPVHAESLHDEHTTSRHFGYFNNCSSSTAEEYSPTFSQTMMHPKAGRTEDWYNRQQQVW